MAQQTDDEILGGSAPALATAALSLARRFAAGGTLWCWSPGSPEHARHVAVEFVHPVIVGTRALPA
nr:hydrogenase assembly protein HupF [Actinomycetota bacterium]